MCLIVIIEVVSEISTNSMVTMKMVGGGGYVRNYLTYRYMVHLSEFARFHEEVKGSLFNTSIVFLYEIAIKL